MIEEENDTDDTDEPKSKRRRIENDESNKKLQKFLEVLKKSSSIEQPNDPELLKKLKPLFDFWRAIAKLDLRVIEESMKYPEVVNNINTNIPAFYSNQLEAEEDISEDDSILPFPLPIENVMDRIGKRSDKDIIAVLEILLANKADLSVAWSELAYRKSEKIFEFLFNQGAKINAPCIVDDDTPDMKGFNITQMAAAHNNVEVLNAIYKQGRQYLEVLINKKTLLHIVAKSQSYKTLLYLYELMADKKITLEKEAIDNEDKTFFDYILENCSSLVASHNELAFTEAKREQIKREQIKKKEVVIQRILRPRDFNCSKSPTHDFLSWCDENFNPDQILNILKRKDKDGNTFLHIAAMNSAVDFVYGIVRTEPLSNYRNTQELLNVFNNEGDTFLHTAAAYSSPREFEELYRTFSSRYGYEETYCETLNEHKYTFLDRAIVASKLDNVEFFVQDLKPEDKLLQPSLTQINPLELAVKIAHQRHDQAHSTLGNDNRVEKLQKLQDALSIINMLINKGMLITLEIEKLGVSRSITQEFFIKLLDKIVHQFKNEFDHIIAACLKHGLPSNLMIDLKFLDKQSNNESCSLQSFYKQKIEFIQAILDQLCYSKLGINPSSVDYLHNLTQYAPNTNNNTAELPNELIANLKPMLLALNKLCDEIASAVRQSNYPEEVLPSFGIITDLDISKTLNATTCKSTQSLGLFGASSGSNNNFSPSCLNSDSQNLQLEFSS